MKYWVTMSGLKIYIKTFNLFFSFDDYQFPTLRPEGSNQYCNTTLNGVCLDLKKTIQGLRSEYTRQTKTKFKILINNFMIQFLKTKLYKLKEAPLFSQMINDFAFVGKFYCCSLQGFTDAMQILKFKLKAKMLQFLIYLIINLFKIFCCTTF